MKTAICANEECNNRFERAAHNQKFCSEDCLRIVTNKRIMKRYYENKERKKGKKRICMSGECATVLSKYNTSQYCSVCQEKKAGMTNLQVIRMFENVTLSSAQD